MTKHIIEGKYSSDGNKIYISTEDDYSYTIVCLNQLIKSHIKENSNIKIAISVDSEDCYKCDYCGRKIPLEESVYLHYDDIGTYCSYDCYRKHLAKKGIDLDNL